MVLIKNFQQALARVVSYNESFKEGAKPTIEKILSYRQKTRAVNKLPLG